MSQFLGPQTIAPKRGTRIGTAKRKNIFKSPAHFLSTGAGLGLAPFAPGTFGTLAGIPICLGLARSPLWLYVAASLVLFAAAVILADKTEEVYEKHDDPRIVIDEVVGLVVTMTGVPPSIPNIILGFMLFRFFDILKPWPCRTLDRKVPGGLGVVLDDVAAGLYSLAALQIIIRCWPA